MAPKHHPTPLSGGDRKALAKEQNAIDWVYSEWRRKAVSFVSARAVQARRSGFGHGTTHQWLR
jgi:hypothetical protein